MQGGPEVGLAGQTFTVGDNRLAFGVIDAAGRVRLRQDRRLRRPDAGREGARARSRRPPTCSSPTRPSARARRRARATCSRRSTAPTCTFPKPGPWSVLTVTQSGGGMLAAPAQVKVVRPGEDADPRGRRGRAAVQTDTVASAKGDEEAIDTRIPTAPELHEESFADVVGQEAGRAAVRHAAAVPVARLRPRDRHRAAAQGEVRRPDGRSSTRRSTSTTTPTRACGRR